MVQELPKNIIENSSILLSRNTPVALIVGVAGFIGSHLAEELLKKNIQVVGIDDLSAGLKANLSECIKDRKFHFINRSITEEINLNLLRLDYAFFVAGSNGVHNFCRIVKIQKDRQLNKSTKTTLVSAISLYKKEATPEEQNLKNAEILFAKYVKEHNLNGRIVRLAPVYGPGMHFDEDDPIFRLIKGFLLNNIQDEETSLEFITRAIYIDDAISLILKTVFSGATSHKIFDGALLQPIRASEIKQLLLDPLWYDMHGFKPTELPFWYTPNLKKTVKELSWQPKYKLVEGLKKTITFFKEVGDLTPYLRDAAQKKQEVLVTKIEEEPEPEVKKQEIKKKLPKIKIRLPKISMPSLVFKKLIFLIGLAIISAGLLLPLVGLGVGGLTIRYHILNSRNALVEGNFAKAIYEVKSAHQTVDQIQAFLDSLAILKRLGVLNDFFYNLGIILSLTEDGIEGAEHATLGMETLIKATKVISGEQNLNPKKLYEQAQTELTASGNKLSKVLAGLTDNSIKNSVSGIFQSRISDLEDKLRPYVSLVEKTRIAAYLMPQISAVDSKKVYLILFQNNMELRPAGGFIGSYARVEFEGGRVAKILVDDIYNLDGNLKEHIEPPIEIKQDLGQKDWFLRDSNFEPDFPTAARQAEFFYNKIAGERVHGVIAMDLDAAGKLINALGGLDLPDYSEKVTQENLFQNVIKHSEIDFFPGSQAKKNYLASLQTQLFNKLFFLSNQNWPAIVSAISESLEQKHIQVYVADPQVFSYISSQNWAGVLPREPEEKIGEYNDLLAVVEANFGANKANYYLKRNLKLETEIGKQQEIYHHLKITYTNESPSSVFPAGTYKNRLRIYLPAGSKLSKAFLGEVDVTSKVAAFSDYGRSGFSLLMEVRPKQETVLSLDYKLQKPLSFEDGLSAYRLDVIKQAGTDKDPFEWVLTYPINMEISQSFKGASSFVQELQAKTNLGMDKTFIVQFKKL